MGFDLDVSIPALTVLVQGVLSFFSPCVLPLLPLYIGYLSGGTVSSGEGGESVYNRKKVMLHTVSFVIGISFAFFLLGFGVSAIGTFFNNRQLVIARIGGGIIILFGMYQLGFLGTSAFLNRERRLPFHLEQMTMSPVTALLMGFSFSFAWTPCVGPALASVLLMTASASSRLMGFLLIGCYTLGFVIPFLLVGIFTTKLLSLFRTHRNVVRYTVKIGGVLMILMGLMMVTGKMNRVTGYLSRLSADSTTPREAVEEEQIFQEDKKESKDSKESKESTENREESDTTEKGGEERTADPQILPALDFSLTDQYGNTHTLEAYKGKTIFLNFWATWCPPCRAEMPDIQKLYETCPVEGDDAVIILGVAGPDYGQEGSVEDITAFLEANGYTYPVLMDTEGELFNGYGISSYPTTFMIDREGNVFGYATGQLSEDIMKDIIEQTLSGERKQADVG